MGTEIRTSEGAVVGYFLSHEEFRRIEYLLAEKAHADQAREDERNGVLRRWDGTNGKSVAEAIAMLETLGREGAGK